MLKGRVVYRGRALEPRSGRGLDRLSGRHPRQSKVTESLDHGERMSLILFVCGEKINITKLLMLSVKGESLFIKKNKYSMEEYRLKM